MSIGHFTNIALRNEVLSVGWDYNVGWNYLSIPKIPNFNGATAEVWNG